eukprot:gnl/TRDRNA2_/TRDRNA2_195002_c0_seq1.p1 gnl/TRDRNA2_/TRDRNA2_195002_c0~~gnl/TRDRNA2_/TRDRNA2_195002_c0_seq1.p1  ORF type:complete len:196 (-),score=36.84 gnl/TRDRNA2_/TRDRNA2_195002_c0_seq1:36-587(-)
MALAALRRAAATRTSFARPLHRGLVFETSSAGGPVATLHADVETAFKQHARGRPAVVSAAQLVQMLYEVGAVDKKSMEVGDAMNTLMMHGFYRQTHPQKRDSYGPPDPPSVGVDECKRWATLFFIERMRLEQRRAQAEKTSVPPAMRKPKQLERCYWGLPRTAPPTSIVSLVPQSALSTGHAK